MVGAHLDWRANQRCHTQLPPVPRDATVDYPCDQILQGQVVSINKTSSDAADMKFLVIRELKVFGYEPGKGVYIIVKLFLTTNTIFPYTGLNQAQGPRESDPSWGSDLPIRPPAPKDHAGQALGLSVC